MGHTPTFPECATLQDLEHLVAIVVDVLTANLPDLGLANGRPVVLYRLAQASSSTRPAGHASDAHTASSALVRRRRRKERLAVIVRVDEPAGDVVG